MGRGLAWVHPTYSVGGYGGNRRLAGLGQPPSFITVPYRTGAADCPPGYSWAGSVQASIGAGILREMSQCAYVGFAPAAPPPPAPIIMQTQLTPTQVATQIPTQTTGAATTVGPGQSQAGGPTLSPSPSLTIPIVQPGAPPSPVAAPPPPIPLVGGGGGAGGGPMPQGAVETPGAPLPSYGPSPSDLAAAVTPTPTGAGTTAIFGQIPAGTWILLAAAGAAVVILLMRRR